MTIQVRALRADERAAWESLYYGYAAFYEVPMNPQILDAVWGWIFDAGESFHCIVAENAEAELVGLMHFREMASPLRGARVGFLDDLFVTPAARGEQVVEALFAGLDAAAREHGWPLVRWITADNNYRARRVYDKVSVLTHWRTYQLDVR